MKKTKQIIVLLIILSMVIAFIPFNAFAALNSTNLDVIFEDTYNSSNGIVQYKNSTDEWITVSSDANGLMAKAVRITNVAEGYTLANFSALRKDGSAQNLTDIFSEDGIALDNDGNYVLEHVDLVSSNQSGSEQKTLKFNFRLNGVDFIDVEGGNITVPADFNMNEITEFYIKKIVVNGTDTYNYNDNEYSYSLLDDQGRKILETNFEKVSDNYVNLRVLSHEGDIQDKDKVEGRIYYGFYLTGIKLVKSGFKGVEVSTPVMPDNYDFTGWNGVDLSGTTKVKPGEVTTYYGEDTISFDSNVASNIKKISLVSNSGVPSSAVSINNTDKTVKVLSNYYNEIPLEIELEDGTKGYVTVDRIGIFVGRLNAGNKVFYHGASADVGENMNVDTDKNRIVAVFYHEDTKTYNDYDLIVNMVFKDGSTKTAIAKGVGDVDNSDGDIVGSDYILWAGDNIEDEPVEVYVTAVSKNALSDSNTFGGATFGSGAGVKWVNE